jgi:hypothetical protein
MRAFASFDEDVVTLLEHWKKHRQESPHRRDYVVDELTRSAVEAWERRFGPLDPGRVDQIRQSFAADSSEVGVAQDANDTFAAFMNDSDLREESTCDVLASVSAVPALVRGGATPDEAIEACAYAMHHLRLLQTINSIAHGSRPQDLARGVSTSMMRLTILRACVGIFLETVFGSDFMTAARCHETITRVNLRHSEVIGDQLWLMTSRALRDLLAADVADAPNRDATREALGFGPSFNARADEIVEA